MRYHSGVDEDPLQANFMRTILFICTGNTCRSPLAEGIARCLLKDRSDEVFVASAGVAAMEGSPTSAGTLATLASHGIEYEGRSNILTPEMIRNASHVLCMTESHAEVARAMVEGESGVQSRIQVLDPDRDLPDPIGQGQAVYDALADQLLRLLPDRLDTLLKEEVE